MSASLRTLARAAARIPVSRITSRAAPRRPFSSSQVLKADAAAAAPKKKPVGAFRGGLFGFLLGSTATGTAAYYYVFDEYKIANELLTEDIEALRTSIQRIEGHVRVLEEQLAEQRAAVVKGKK